MKIKYLGWVVQSGLTILLPIWLLHDFSWKTFQSLMLSVPFWFYSLAFLIFTVAQAIFVLRWMVILQAMPIRIPFLKILEQHYIGVYFNNFFPAMIGGDSAKIYYMGQTTGYTNVTSSVFMERFLGFFATAVLATVMSWTFQVSDKTHWVRLALTAFTFGFIMAFLLILYFPLERLLKPILRRLPKAAFLETRFTLLFHNLRTIGRKPQVILKAFAITAIYFLLIAPIYIGFFYFAADRWIPLAPLMIGLLSISILSNIPITINGIGLREQLHYLFFIPLGLSKEEAVSVSLLIFSYLLLSSAVGYTLWLKLQMPLIENSSRLQQ